MLLGIERRRIFTISRLTSGAANIVLPGWLDQIETRRLLSHAHVGLIPWNSIPDAMPNKLFEYLAASLPVVSSAAGEMSRLIANTRIGRSYRAGSANELVDVLNKCLGTKFQPDYIENPHAHYQNFTEADLDKVRSALGYQPQFSLERGVADYLEWLYPDAKR